MSDEEIEEILDQIESGHFNVDKESDDESEDD